MVLPKRFATYSVIPRPTAVDPVKDTNGTLGSLTISLPIIAPPPVRTLITDFHPWAAKTSTIIFPRAIVTREVL